MDPDGYPDDAELDRIRSWPHDDLRGLFEFLKPRWRYSDTYLWQELPDGVYHLSTGGWSGNESLVSAFEENCIAWGVCWVQSRRGGHYQFELPPWELRGGKS